MARSKVKVKPKFLIEICVECERKPGGFVNQQGQRQVGRRHSECDKVFGRGADSAEDAGGDVHMTSTKFSDFLTPNPQPPSLVTYKNQLILFLLSVFVDSLSVRTSYVHTPQAARLMLLLHKYARENLLVANIYIKDPAVTLITRDQKIPVIWDG